MHEVERLCDTLSVFRNGRHVETFAKGEHSDAEIVRMMIGRDVTAQFPPKPAPVERQPHLVVLGLRWENRLNGVDLTVGKGEIVGLGGLDGQGQKELLLALFGVLRGVEGKVTAGPVTGLPASPAAAKSGAARLALVPEDRKTEGLMLPMSIADNLLASAYGKVSRGPFIDPALERAAVSEAIAKLQIKLGSPTDAVATLSGGNQQKVVIAKWLMTDPGIILLNDPTRGIDVGTKQEIYKLMRALADEGRAILFYSTDYAELIGCCDRVAVMYGGRVLTELTGKAITEEAIVAAALNLDTGAAHDRPEECARHRHRAEPRFHRRPGRFRGAVPRLSPAPPARVLHPVLVQNANEAVALAFVAMAQTLPVLAGGLDLSVGAVMTLCACIASVLVNGEPYQIGLGMIVTLLCGTGFGLVNGLIVVHGRLQPIIATLATGAIAIGLALFIGPSRAGRSMETSTGP